MLATYLVFLFPVSGNNNVPPSRSVGKHSSLGDRGLTRWICIAKPYPYIYIYIYIYGENLKARSMASGPQFPTYNIFYIGR